jgi:hypothetical protein
VSEWLPGRTAALDDTHVWTTLPQVQHALGCDSYGAAAAVDAGMRHPSAADGSSTNGSLVSPHQQQQQRALAHEAGYDAFMTGVVFVGLLRLHNLAQRECV